VTNAHSLEVETAAELGLLGLLALALLVGGVIAAARTALARNAAAAAGPSAALLAWFLHASIDWDWQLPAVSLPAIVLAGAIVAIAESAPRGAAEERRDRRGERSLALSAGAGR
jgi:O-antigen ligase